MTTHTTTSATGSTELPLTLDEVTPAWLSGALGTAFAGVRVGAVTRQGERAGTSTSATFVLDYEDDGGHADLPRSVYIKGGFDEVMRRRVWVALIQEARFFAELAPDVPINIPRSYFSGVDEAVGQGVVILEDMAPRGVEFGHITRDRGPDTVARVIELQARLHARFWNSPRLDAYADWGQPQRVFLRYLLREKSWDDVLTRAYGDRILDIFPDRDFALRALERCWELDDALPRTLLHGDPHSGNQFFEADGAPGFNDWQCTFPGAPGHDHAEMLVSSLSVEERRAHERDLIAHYREVLVAEGVADAPSLDELFLSYRQNQAHNMVQSVFNPYDMQTQEVTDTSAGRTLAAAADLDLIGALAL
ncbi:phosphotransferase [Nocardioides sp. LHD-245]|uniref:phosphotransferase n=1 Tax=Nocardioides sp. LHD-245 TaxID=3051387 RepID=UPI0027E055CD|nr:phosphotransferase [Nocardioides sp. LHD-245]